MSRRRAGGTNAPILRRRADEMFNVAWSPRGNSIAFSTARYDDRGDIRIGTVKPDGSGARRLAAFGLRERIARAGEGGPVWSPDGTRVAYERPLPGRLTPAQAEAQFGELERLQVVVAARDGRILRRSTNTKNDGDPRWSPDGRQILFSRLSGDGASTRLGVLPSRSGPARFVGGRFESAIYDWAPDGRSLVVTGVTAGADPHDHLYLVDAGDRGRPRALPGEPAIVRPAFSPDGRTIAFAGYGGAIETVTPSGTSRRTLARLEGAEILELAWSPDGSRLAFTARKEFEGD